MREGLLEKLKKALLHVSGQAEWLRHGSVEAAPPSAGKGEGRRKNVSRPPARGALRRAQFELKRERGNLDKAEMQDIFHKYCRKLRIVPAWDVKLEFVEDPAWRKTGDFKIDCDDKKAVLMLNVSNPKQENMEEVIVHELMHLKMYPLDQVTESLIINTFEEGSAASNFAYQQFFTALEQTVEELTKCFLLEFGDEKELSFGRCKGMRSFNDLFDGLKSID